MSGIFGYIQNNNITSSDAVNLSSMQKWNYAYGKEYSDLISASSFGFGICQDDLNSSISHNKPILIKADTYAVIDALIYNREELITKCKVSSNLSDEELLFEYILQHGFSLLKEVNGDFSGAVYFRNSNKLLLFRDHMGIRPLFYYTNENYTIFSTDIRGLVALSQVDTSINEHWIHSTISGQISQNLISTEFAHISCVSPATFMEFTYKCGKLATKATAYWVLGSKKIRFSTESAYMDRLRELITDAIKRRLDITTGLVGAELSGGLDSSVIDILIHHLNRECLHFSWSYGPDELSLAKNDERFIIDDICKQENICCHYRKKNKKLDTDSNIARTMHELGLSSADELSVFNFIFPPYINTLPISETSQFMHDHNVHFIFTGHGGDEGVSHRCNPYEIFYHHEYYHFLRYIWSTTHGNKHRILNTLKQLKINLFDTRRVLINTFETSLGVPELLRSDFQHKMQKKRKKALYFAYDSVKYINHGGSRSRLDNVALQGAYSGVRYLIPYLDYRVIDYAVSIPRYLYLRGRRDRFIFRETFNDILPPSLYTLRLKRETSRENIEKDPNRLEIYKNIRAEIMKHLNRAYWGKYLNFELIDAWSKQENPSDDEQNHNDNILNNLLLCAMLDNVIAESREM